MRQLDALLDLNRQRAGSAEVEFDLIAGFGFVGLCDLGQGFFEADGRGECDGLGEDVAREGDETEHCEDERSIFSHGLGRL